MKTKVKELFSRIFVKTYDYPFIIGFLEANGIEGVVPSLNEKNNRTCINYEMFKDWWKQNCMQKHPKDADASVNDGNCGIRSEVNPNNGNVKYIIVRGDKPVVIDMGKVLDEFLQYNIKQAERVLFDIPHFKDLEYFIRNHIVSDIFD